MLFPDNVSFIDLAAGRNKVTIGVGIPTSLMEGGKTYRDILPSSVKWFLTSPVFDSLASIFMFENLSELGTAIGSILINLERINYIMVHS